MSKVVPVFGLELSDEFSLRAVGVQRVVHLCRAARLQAQSRISSYADFKYDVTSHFLTFKSLLIRNNQQFSRAANNVYNRFFNRSFKTKQRHSTFNNKKIIMD